MKDLEKLYQECKEEMILAGIDFDKSYPIQWYKAKSCWGKCHYTPKKIQISDRLSDDYVSDKSVKTVILHEMLHTNDKCHNHGEFFKRYASKLNNQFGYNIQRLGSYEMYGVKREAKSDNKDRVVVCEDCGHEWLYNHKRKFIRKYKPGSTNYTCPYCKGHDFLIFKRTPLTNLEVSNG